MKSEIPREYSLPPGVYVDFKNELEIMFEHRAHEVRKHFLGGCAACFVGPTGVELLSHEDMLRHWKLSEIKLEECIGCGREYPETEYILSDVAPICRHCFFEKK